MILPTYLYLRIYHKLSGQNPFASFYVGIGCLVSFISRFANPLELERTYCSFMSFYILLQWVWYMRDLQYRVVGTFRVNNSFVWTDLDRQFSCVIQSTVYPLFCNCKKNQVLFQIFIYRFTLEIGQNVFLTRFCFGS